jgi:hypothetical protein
MSGERETSASGRKVVLVVVLVAFAASATTAMLAFNASHRARERDVRAIAEDGTYLRGELSQWQAQVADAARASGDARQAYNDRLAGRTRALSAWKPRTPCGQQAKDGLVKAMESHVRAMLHGAVDADISKERTSVEAALRPCEAAREA